jgi:entericidin A
MMKTKMFLTLCLAAFMTACNTIEGVGKDLGKAGEKIEEAAKKK